MYYFPRVLNSLDLDKTPTGLCTEVRDDWVAVKEFKLNCHIYIHIYLYIVNSRVSPI